MNSRCFFSSEGALTSENRALVTAEVSNAVLVHELPGRVLGGLQRNPGAAGLSIILQDTPGSRFSLSLIIRPRRCRCLSRKASAGVG